MQIAKWGNSLAIRIPADVARSLGLKVGDRVELKALSDGEYAVISEAQRRAALIAQLRSFRGSLPADYKFDREEANAR